MQPSDLDSLKVSAQTVQSIAVRNMREAIVSGLFQPGERLVEAEMCSRLGISRPSLREALRALEAQRLIVMVPNKGPSIPVLSSGEAREIYSVRALLEGEAVALAAARRSDAAVARMQSALEDFDRAVESGDLRSQLTATRSFYDQIMDCCGHHLLCEMLSTLLVRITFLRSKSMSQEGRSLKSSREMWAIFRQIAAGNSEKARAASIKHVEKACETAMKAFGDDPRPRRAARK